MRGATYGGSPALAYSMAELLCPTNADKGCRRRAVAGCPSGNMAEFIPQEVMVIIASCIPVSLTFEGYGTAILKTKLLPLRCASKAWHAAVAVAVKDHPGCSYYCLDEFCVNRPERVLNYARVFGGGCRSLRILENCVGTRFPICQAFVEWLGGGLVSLDIHFDRHVTAAQIIELGRLCPRLKQLQVEGNYNDFDEIGINEDNIDELAAGVSAACPLLEKVVLPTWGYSPVETYAMHFPRLLRLDFTRVDGAYEPPGPWLLDKVEASANACLNATECYFDEPDVDGNLPDLPLAETLARTSLRSRLTRIEFSPTADVRVSDETLLCLARGLPALRDLNLPCERGGLNFHKALCRARPELTRLGLGWDSRANDACVRHICERLRLESIQLESGSACTAAIVDIIIASPCGRTLREAEFNYISFMNLAKTLRLVRGCPNLSVLKWSLSEHVYRNLHRDLTAPYRDVPGLSLCSFRELLGILRSRGGRLESYELQGLIKKHS